jgi:hypothetical protein
MKKLVRITDEYIQIADRNITWDQIVGVRHFDASWMRQVGTRLPFSEIFLKGGDVIKISSNILLEGPASVRFDDAYKQAFNEYFTVMAIISDRAKNISQDISEWKEWRLLLPVIVVEAALLLYGIIDGKDITGIITFFLAGGVMAIPLGWVWEKKARRTLWK